MMFSIEVSFGAEVFTAARYYAVDNLAPFLSIDRIEMFFNNFTNNNIQQDENVYISKAALVSINSSVLNGLIKLGKNSKILGVVGVDKKSEHEVNKQPLLIIESDVVVGQDAIIKSRESQVMIGKNSRIYAESGQG